MLLDPPLELTDHHAASIVNLRDRFVTDPTVVALLLGGSLAHGFASSHADVDFIAVVTPAEYARRAEVGELTKSSTEGCTYQGGYFDGKFVDVNYVRRVAESGSEPARFAFADARFVIDREPAVRPLLDRIVTYPVAGVAARIERFAAQLHAWRWYHSQAMDKQSRYLETLAIQKLVLFSCRLVLAENRLLYPYHKWMLRVTEGAAHRPESLMTDLDRILYLPDAAFIDQHVRSLLAFYGIDHDGFAQRWGSFFLHDNEQTWVGGDASIDDL